MKHSKSLFCLGIMFLYAGICMAGAGKEAILLGKSESGKTQIVLKKWDVYDAVSLAQVIINGDTVNFEEDCDNYSILDLPNHLLTIFFQQKGTSPDAPTAKSLKIWGIPSSFVKTVGSSEYNWRFKAKIDYRGSGKTQSEIIKLDCTFDWNP